MTPGGDRLWIKLGVLLVSTILTLFAVEWSYRLKLRTMRRRTEYDYRVSPIVPVAFDAKYGVHPKPNLVIWACYMLDGKVAWGSVVARSNQDGLVGKSTLQDYETADVRILAFGDSFTEWNQDGVTWPDLLERKLREQTGKRVVVLNYARAGYGVLQMLDLAADRINQLHPDLAIIAAIGDDFSRARWWSRELERNGFRRFLLSSNKDNFDDYRFAVDQVLIVPQATPQWCEGQLHHPNPRDPVLLKANNQFAAIKREVESVRKAVPLLSWDYSFVYRRLTTGSPYIFPDGNMPRLSITDFRQDAEASADAAAIRSSGSRILLVYLPTMDEMKSRKLLAAKADRKLMESVEEMLGMRLRLIQQEYNGKVPGKIDLRPYDWHPNRQGMELYAAAIAPIAQRQLADSRPGAAHVRSAAAR